VRYKPTFSVFVPARDRPDGGDAAQQEQGTRRKDMDRRNIDVAHKDQSRRLNEVYACCVSRSEFGTTSEFYARQ
jgi:hypothetical protein